MATVGLVDAEVIARAIREDGLNDGLLNQPRRSSELGSESPFFFARTFFRPQAKQVERDLIRCQSVVLL